MKAAVAAAAAAVAGAGHPAVKLDADDAAATKGYQVAAGVHTATAM